MKTELAERVVDLAATRDLEKRICGQKKAVVEDYFDAVDKQVAQYQVCRCSFAALALQECDLEFYLELFNTMTFFALIHF